VPPVLRPVATWVLGSRLRTALLLAAALVLVALLDLARDARSWSVLGTAVLDEPAHLATAALLLAAFLPRRATGLAPWALAGAVLIDLDHAPLYLWGVGTADGYGRPVTHSLLTVVVLACAGAVTRRGVRTALLGLSLGVVLHLFRDLGTGPGAPLWWPAGQHSVLVPYPVYLGATAVVAAVAVGRWCRPRPAVRTGASARP
jgi:inner membrane protein